MQREATNKAANTGRASRRCSTAASVKSSDSGYEAAATTLNCGWTSGDGRTAPRRLALNATNLDEAKGELERKLTERRDDKLPRTGHRPHFEAFARQYLDSASFAEKKPGTRKLEGWAIDRWTAHLGGVRVDKITPALIYSYREKRLKQGLKARNVNLDTIALRNVLKLARERELIERLPEMRQLKEKPSPKQALLTEDGFGRLLAAATAETTKNSDLFRLHLCFLALTGAREKTSPLIPCANRCSEFVKERNSRKWDSTICGISSPANA